MNNERIIIESPFSESNKPDISDVSLSENKPFCPNVLSESGNVSQLTDLFKQLVSINATSGLEKPVANFIKNYIFNNLPLHNYQISYYEDGSSTFSNSNSGNIIFKFGSGGDFVLLSHLDTVSPTEGINIIIDNNIIKTDGKTILGADNRAGIAAILHSIYYCFKNNIPLKDFSIAFTVCEETTLDGSRFLELPDSIKYGFVFDSSYPPGKFIYSSPGAVAFNIKITGKSSHSGISPEAGINSIMIAARAISQINQGRIDKDTTLNIGKISGGSAVNVVPEVTEIVGEIRSFNLNRIKSLLNEVKSVFLNETKKFNASMDFIETFDFFPYTHKLDDVVISRISAAITNTGLEPKPIISFGGSDANSLNEKGINTVNIGIGAQNPHSFDECISIDDLISSHCIALNLIKK